MLCLLLLTTATNRSKPSMETPLFPVYKKQNQTLRQGYTEIRRQLLYAVSAAYPVPEGQNHRRAVLYPVAICHCGGNRSTERLYFRLMPIDLAIGLPPAHFGTQNKAFVRYFKRKEPIYFSYRDKLYSILIRDVQCYPQAFAAAAMMLGELATVPRALILDVGGFTADYLMLKNGHADPVYL